ncbi:MAG: nucleotidyltransferase domain-containing protein [Chloroflexi bacterium]|nr:nucleotidyltransferase domain-containing protein [Chloroflexota bacterium]
MPHLQEENAREVAGAVERLVDALHPERIYVFGSWARGEASPDRAIELLVLVSHSDLPPHRRDQEATRVLGSPLVPIDLLVVTRKEFQRRSRAEASLPGTVLREGRTLYAGRVFS